MQNKQNAGDLVLRAAHHALGAHGVMAFVQDEIGRFVLKDFSCDDNSLIHGLRLEPGKGLAGWVLRNKQSLMVNDFDQRTSRVGYYDNMMEGELTGFVGCPLPNGVICADRTSGTPFSENDLDLLQIFTELYVCQAQNMTQEVQDDARRYFTRFERIQELRSQYPQWRQYLPHFLRLLAQASEFDHVAFASLKDDSDTFMVEAESASLLLSDNMPVELPIAGALAGWVFRNDVPVHTEGLDGAPTAALYGKIKDVPQFQSVICLPVTVNRSTSAVLCMGGVEPRPIPQSLRSFVRMSTDELVQFLENLYLRHRVRSLMPKANVYREGAVAYNPEHGPLTQEED